MTAAGLFRSCALRGSRQIASPKNRSLTYSPISFCCAATVSGSGPSALGKASVAGSLSAHQRNDSGWRKSVR